MEPSPKERFAAYLARKKHGLPESKARVVDAVFSLPGRFTAEGLVASVPEGVSRATVYRTLFQLVEAGLLRQIESDGEMAYESTGPSDIAGA